MAWSSWSSWSSSLWGSGNSPNIYFQWRYRYDRSGADMMYQVNCRVYKPSGTYGYNIYCNCYMDGSYKFGTYLKESSTTSWTYYPSESGYTSSTYYISKTSGSVTLKFNVYSPNAGTSRSTDFTQSMTVTPAGSGIAVSAPGGSYVLGDNSNYAQINLTRYSTSFSDVLSSSPSGLSQTITGSTSSYDWKPVPLSFSANNLTGTTVPITVYTNTMSGSTLVERKSASFTASIPSYVKPTNPVLTITDNKGYASTYGAYIQNMSEVRINMSSNTYSGNGYTDTAAITSASITAGNNTYSPNISQVGSTTQYTTSDLYIVPGTAGSRTITGSVTDARGRTSSVSTPVSIDVLAYTNPVITSARAFRCNSGGSAAADGTYAQLVLSASVTDFGTTTNNNGSYSASYVIKDGDGNVVNSGTKQLGTGLVANNLSLESNPISGLNATYTMDVTFTATDNFGSTATSSTTVSIVKKFLSANSARTGLGVGKLSTKQDGGLEIGMQTYYDSDVTTVKHESSGDAVFFDSTTSQMKIADGTVVSAQQGGLAALDYEIITSW